ncbi:transposase [Streptomyces sp. NPDC052077]|uniref:transposase n=1 Tax=Streptomyces sp. NPDC052077 TaxID=3154757 RepID=UPI003433651A
MPGLRFWRRGSTGTIPAPRKCPDELRERAIREVRGTGRPIAHVAKDLGIHKEALRGWVRQAEADRGERDDRLLKQDHRTPRNPGQLTWNSHRSGVPPVGRGRGPGQGAGGQPGGGQDSSRRDSTQHSDGPAASGCPGTITQPGEPQLMAGYRLRVMPLFRAGPAVPWEWGNSTLRKGRNACGFPRVGRPAVACFSAKVQYILAQIEWIARNFSERIPYDRGHAGTFRRRTAG